MYADLDLVEIPASPTSIQQGDIFHSIYFNAVDDELEAVLITPACDIAQKKTKYLHFCAVIPFEAIYFSLLEKSKSLKKEQFVTIDSVSNKKYYQNASDVIKEFLHNNINQYQWLGHLPGYETIWIVDFQLQECIPFDEKTILKKKICSLKSPLREAIYIRCASYMSRVGLPDAKDENMYLSNVIKKMQGLI